MDSLGLADLRQRTRPIHESLERHVDLMRAEVTRQDYVRYLRAMASVIGLGDAALVTLAEPPRLPDATDRRKAHLLQRDLAALGESALVVAAEPPVDPARAFGCAYVFEGSTLGGVVLARHLLPRLGLSADAGASFLRCYGDDVGPRWKTFLEHLAPFLDDDRTRRVVIDGALATFAAVTRAFTGRS